MKHALCCCSVMNFADEKAQALVWMNDNGKVIAVIFCKQSV